MLPNSRSLAGQRRRGTQQARIGGTREGPRGFTPLLLEPKSESLRNTV